MSGNSKSMIEKVARAICLADGRVDPDAPALGGGFCWMNFERQARAAIEAMREPTEAMLDTMAMRGDPEDLKWVYQQMIDAALPPTSPDD